MPGQKIIRSGSVRGKNVAEQFLYRPATQQAAWLSTVAIFSLFLGIAVQRSAGQELGGNPPERTNLQAIAEKSPPSIERPSIQRETKAQPGTTGGTAPLSPDDYVIGEQDALTITVWKEKEISGSVVVRPDGKITVPLVGELRVVGMTPVQVQTTLAEKLKPYVTVPQVTVAVNQINSRKVYLIGQVMREGTFQINSSTTVLQIIAQAGGLKDFAKRKKIYILRQRGQTQVRYSFNYDSVIQGKNTDQNILLEPGDTIVAP